MINYLNINFWIKLSVALDEHLAHAPGTMKMSKDLSHTDIASGGSDKTKSILTILCKANSRDMYLGDSFLSYIGQKGIRGKPIPTKRNARL